MHRAQVTVAHTPFLLISWQVEKTQQGIECAAVMLCVMSSRIAVKILTRWEAFNFTLTLRALSLLQGKL